MLLILVRRMLLSNKLHIKHVCVLFDITALNSLHWTSFERLVCETGLEIYGIHTVVTH
jgi:hypothetical protein